MKKITHNQSFPCKKGIKNTWILEGDVRPSLLQIYLNLKTAFYLVKQLLLRMHAKKSMRQTGIYSCLFLSIIGNISIANAHISVEGKVFKPGAGIVASETMVRMGGNAAGAPSDGCVQNTCEKDSTGVFVVGRGNNGLTYQMGWESGKYGVVLGKGVVLLLEGQLQSTFLYNNPTTKGVTVTFSSSAEPSSTTGLNKLNDGVAYFSAANGGGGNYTTGWPQATGQITASLWIGPDAEGVYKIPRVGVAPNNDIVSTNFLQGGGEFTVLTPLSCTISSPPTIDFGTVNLWNFSGNSTGSPGGARKDVLGVVDGNLSISCESDTPDITTTAKLTLNGTIETYSNDLRVTMDSTGNPAPATIRSSIKNITSACAIEGIHFTPSTSNPDANKVSIDQLGVGQTNIPYRFSLCAYPELGLNQFGSASAQATITLDWD